MSNSDDEHNSELGPDSQREEEDIDDFEEQRKQRIAQNKARLQQLQLGQAVEKIESQKAANKPQRKASIPKNVQKFMLPERSRSTRASAVKAQEQMKEQLGAVPKPAKTANKKRASSDDDDEDDDDDFLSSDDDMEDARASKRKRRLEVDDEFSVDSDDEMLAESDEDMAGDVDDGSGQRSKGSPAGKGSGKGTQRRGSKLGVADDEDAMLQRAMIESLRMARQRPPAGSAAPAAAGNAQRLFSAPGGAAADRDKPTPRLGNGNKQPSAHVGVQVKKGPPAPKSAVKGKGSVQRSSLKFNLTEGEIVDLFEQLCSEKKGVITAKTLFSTANRLGMDYDEDKAARMLDYAMNTVAKDEGELGLGSSSKGSEALTLEQFQLLLGSLMT